MRQKELRKTGIDVIGDAPWATHFCQFYQTKEDLLDILVPYFKAGLENNEFCMWITAEPLSASEAKKAMAEAVSDFYQYMTKGQMEIIPHTEWYLKDGRFESQRVLNGWVEKLDQALANGYVGLRLTGNTFWLEKKDWRSFTDYEAAINNVIGKYNMLALCTYCLDKCNANEIIDVLRNHEFALIKQEGKWELIEIATYKKTKEMLAVSEAKLAHLASFPELNPMPIVELDMNGNISYVNPAAKTLFPDVQTAGSEHPFLANCKALANRFQSEKREYITRELIIGDTWYEQWISYTPASQSIRFRANDITERKQTEEALREARDYLNNLLDYANAPIIVWNPQFRITRFNHAFERLIGLKAEDVLGKKLDILFARVWREESMIHIGRAIAGERWEVVEIPILRNDGTICTVLWNSATLYAADGKTAVATIAQGQDITGRKEAEEALKRKTDELARSNAELEQFAYIASHDLQEPLRMVSSYVQLLANRYKGKLDKDADDFINYAHDGATRMQQLINDLLTYSRVGTREMNFEEVSLETVFTRALDNLKIAIKDTTAVVTHDPLPIVYGDGVQLTRVFQNLVGNAIKFHGDEPPRTHVTAELKAGECICSVRDNGIGIAPEHMGKIFFPFQRLHARREYPGMGIGLAICKRIVERHHGRIWVESNLGTGSTFYFTVPTMIRKE